MRTASYLAKRPFWQRRAAACWVVLKIVAHALCPLKQEQLHLRRWLQQHGTRSVLASPPRGAAEDECYVCGTLPYLAAVRCSCAPARVTCLHHGFMMCDCRGVNKSLEVRVADAELESVLSPADRAAEAARAAPPVAAQPVAAQPQPLLPGSGKRVREDDAAAKCKPVERTAAPPSAQPAGQCSECGGRGGRSGLLRCLACDAGFHRKCGDMRSRGRGAELSLCPSCYDAQF